MSKKKPDPVSAATWHECEDPLRLITWPRRQVGIARRYLLLSCAIIRNWPGGVQSELGKSILAGLEAAARPDAPPNQRLLDVLLPRLPDEVWTRQRWANALTERGASLLGADGVWVATLLMGANDFRHAPHVLPHRLTLLVTREHGVLRLITARETDAEIETIRKELPRHGLFGRVFGAADEPLRDAILARLPKPPKTPTVSLAFAAQELRRQRHKQSRKQFRALACGLVREVFGDPFRPWHPNAAWLAAHDGAARSIAESIARSGDYAAMPVLGDALEDAGCADDAALEHCRGGGPHGLGCWVVEAVLGR